jgi:hypothetical protein
MPQANGWTSERREQQAVKIRAARPWLRSTGPRTPAGKAKAAQNARKHGLWSAATVTELRALRGYLRAARKVEREALLRC